MVTPARLPIWVISSTVLTLLASCADGEHGSTSRKLATSEVGGVEIHLDVAGSQLTAVDMKVYRGGEDGDPPLISKNVAVGTPPVLTAFTGALNPGDYDVTFDATTPDGTPCSGAGTFTVVADTTSETQLDLVCGSTFAANAPRGQYVFVIQAVRVVNCPVLDKVSVAPLQTSGVVSLSTEVYSPSPSAGPVRVEWRDGIQPVVSGASGVLDCSGRSDGTHSITVTATVPGSACASSLTTDVTCVAK